MNYDAWLEIEILTGLQRLICLGLERQPAGEILPVTAQVWCEALTIGRAWDEHRDIPRIRQAFVVLAKTRRHWPTPPDFADLMPAIDQRTLAAPRPSIEEIQRHYGVEPVIDKPKTTSTTEVVEQMRQLYTPDRKSAAAGDVHAE